MSKHTPGPWVLEKAVGTDDMDCGWSVLPVMVDYKYRGELCHLSDAEHIEGITKDERDANARLIASAPDLLEALQEMVREFGYDVVHPNGLVHDEHEAIRSAMAAIAKATGEQP
jgi:hypothetical protein